MKKYSVTLTLQGWDEKEELGNKGETRVASVATGFRYSGDIEGESTIRYLLQYNADGRGDYVGWEQLNGRIGERTGSILLKHVGRFESHGIEVTIESVPDSGIGALATMSLKSSQSLSGKGPYTVEYISENSI